MSVLDDIRHPSFLLLVSTWLHQYPYDWWNHLSRALGQQHHSLIKNLPWFITVSSSFFKNLICTAPHCLCSIFDVIRARLLPHNNTNSKYCRHREQQENQHFTPSVSGGGNSGFSSNWLSYVTLGWSFYVFEPLLDLCKKQGYNAISSQDLVTWMLYESLASHREGWIND